MLFFQVFLVEGFFVVYHSTTKGTVFGTIVVWVQVVFEFIDCGTGIAFGVFSCHPCFLIVVLQPRPVVEI